MRLVAHRGSRSHAPENSRIALISAYTAGADVLEFDLQLTKDGHLVLSHDPDVKRLTNADGAILDLSLEDLRELDFSETFQPPDSAGFSYYRPESKGRRLSIETLPEILDLLPDDIELLIELKHDSSLHSGRREEFVSGAVAALAARGAIERTVIYSKDPANLKLATSIHGDLRFAAFDYELAPAQQLDLLAATRADGLVTALENVLDAQNELTPFAADLQAAFGSGSRLGAILYPRSGVFTAQQYEALASLPWIWSLSTDSMITATALTRTGLVHTDEPFAGSKVDTHRFALGYAKANPYARVFQDDGIHVEIGEFTGAFPGRAADPLERRVQSLENDMLFVAKDWPYYSGGGVGTVRGIRGDFAAEVRYTVENVAQATTLEMAVTNVDPGAHQPSPPTSFRHKDSFYDPHGCPPYVGIEHDENDGYRLNWNLGVEYDSNQYGKPVGDGSAPRGARLRLERRGSYFAAYYRDPHDAEGALLPPKDWVCVGVIRNESLNPTVHLRCAGKRWRQEKESDPSQFEDVIPNHFTFRDLKITTFPRTTHQEN